MATIIFVTEHNKYKQHDGIRFAYEPHLINLNNLIN